MKKFWLYVNDYPDEFGIYEVREFRDEDEDEDMIEILDVIYQKHEAFRIGELAVLDVYDYSRLSEDGKEVLQFLLSEGRE